VANSKRSKIRKHLKPEDIIIIRDTREKAAVDLAPLRVISGTLSTGDFSVMYLTDRIAIERKELGDLVACVGVERERFEREIQRLLAYETKAIVVEASWKDIETHNYRSQTSPEAVMGSILGWIARGVPIVMADDNKRAGRFIARLLFTAARRHWASVYPFISSAQDQNEFSPEISA
jgi:DNA excision repair protein ERCC-4